LFWQQWKKKKKEEEVEEEGRRRILKRGNLKWGYFNIILLTLDN
jgi:hypothetical protein